MSKIEFIECSDVGKNHQGIEEMKVVFKFKNETYVFWLDIEAVLEERTLAMNATDCYKIKEGVNPSIFREFDNVDEELLEMIEESDTDKESIELYDTLYEWSEYLFDLLEALRD